MSTKDRLVYAIIKFLANEVADPTLGEDAKESIEVAKQCLETAYGMEDNARPELELGADLTDIVESIPPCRQHKAVTAEMKADAEVLKSDGNEHMKSDRFQDAVDAYTKAINIDNSNAIYYSNRAAAYNKMMRFYEAADDCDEAISIDATYSKAYGRKGLALSGLNQHTEAIESYRKAIELDPNNQNFQTNLEIAEEKARSTSQSGPGLPTGPLGSMLNGGGGGGGMPDLGALLNNPAMMNMAAQMMQNPAMQQMMGNLVTGMQGGAPPPTDNIPDITPPPAPPAGGVDNLLRAGQQFAEQLQRSNPELVDQLRNQFQGGPGEDNQPDNQPDNSSQ